MKILEEELTMAKENFAQLIGKVINVKIDENVKVGQLTIEVMRRNGRIDTPSVIAFESVFEKIKDIKSDDFIIVKGIVGTSKVMKTYICPSCGYKTNEESLITSVIMIDMIKLTGTYQLEELKEFSNNVFLLGSLCRDVKVQTLKSGIKNAQYQLAVNRKLNVKEQSDRYTDYPFISSLAEQAEQDSLRLEEGSQCFVNGGLQTRKVLKNHTCSNCNEGFKIQEEILEVCPYNTEYLNNCNFD